jgi:hypothetical protein
MLEWDAACRDYSRRKLTYQTDKLPALSGIARHVGSRLSRYNPVKGLGSWLTPDLYRIGGAPGYKAVGRAHIYDSITTINTFNYPHVHMLHL